jgi:hypothetical protein
MSRNQGAVGAQRTQGLPKPSRSYPSGRTCSEPGCSARISIYNRNDRCWLHLGLKVPRMRGRKARTEGPADRGACN